MKSFKKIAVAVMGAFVLALAGCTTLMTRPVQDTAAFPADSSTYTVLGRVSISVPAQKTGFTLTDAVGYNALLAKANSEFSGAADDVVNVKVDIVHKWVWILIIPVPTVDRYDMSGIAISYNK